jgi:ubiquinone/menaquinone biosynthesis C-methylase UbiE
MLADRLGLSSRVTYRQGSALAMPFDDAAFDVVWTQHAAMNIADKAKLYAEIWRVLRPGRWFALYDILAGLAVCRRGQLCAPQAAFKHGFVWVRERSAGRLPAVFGQ